MNESSININDPILNNQLTDEKKHTEDKPEVGSQNEKSLSLANYSQGENECDEENDDEDDESKFFIGFYG